MYITLRIVVHESGHALRDIEGQSRAVFNWSSEVQPQSGLRLGFIMEEIGTGSKTLATLREVQQTQEVLRAIAEEEEYLRINVRTYIELLKHPTLPSRMILPLNPPNPINLQVLVPGVNEDIIPLYPRY